MKIRQQKKEKICHRSIIKINETTISHEITMICLLNYQQYFTVLKSRVLLALLINDELFTSLPEMLMIKCL